MVKERQVKKLYQLQHQLNVRMSSLTRPTSLTGQGVVNPLAAQGVQNPIAGLSDKELQVSVDISDERELIKSLESHYQ